MKRSGNGLFSSHSLPQILSQSFVIGPLRIAIVFLVLLFGTISMSSAQVTLSLNPPSGFQFKSEDVWNFNVISASRENVKVQFVAQINLNGKPVVKLTSAETVLKPGANSFFKSTLRTQTVAYLDVNLGKLEKKLGFLPSGNYNYCLVVLCRENPKACERKINFEMQIEACQDVVVEQNSPLILASPDDESTIKEKRPNFSWIPPMPIGSDPDIRYKLTLVQLKKDQSAEDGIQRNRAIYRNKRIAGVMLLFPQTLDDLIPGEKYAWQVEAHMNGTFIARSEVWEFEVENELPVNLSYFKLKPRNEGHFAKAIDNYLPFTFDERYALAEHQMQLSYRILSSDKKTVISDWDNLPKNVGANFYILDLGEDGLGLEKGTYLLEVQNKKKQKKYLKFYL